MPEEKPILSFVCVSRNDNHGGNPLERLIYSCKNFIRQSEKFRASTEYIVVEWNPPPDRPSLVEALRGEIRSSKKTKVRLIQVPEAIHRKYDYSDKLPLFQMIGKNAGIRRAQGEFVLSSNIDILLGDRIFSRVVNHSLKKEIIYRSHRLDIRNNILEQEFNEDLALNSATRINVMPNTIQLGLGAAILKNFRGFSARPAKQYRQIFYAKLSCFLKRLLRSDSKNNFPLHTNACGDFQLLDQKTWHRLGGFSEMEVYSFHLDSLFMYSALANGVYSVVLPAPLYHYHIDHDHGWIPEDPGRLFNRLRSEKIGFLDQEIGIIEELYRRRQLVPEPRNDWGLAGHKLEETIL